MLAHILGRGIYPALDQRAAAPLWKPSDRLPVASHGVYDIFINKDAQRVEGIEKIADDGTVVCTDHSAKIMREVLGYECKEVKPDEAKKKWKELTTAYKNRLRNMKSEDELETNKKPM